MTLRRRILLLATGLPAVVLVLFAAPLAIALRQSASDRVVHETEYVAQGVADYLTTNVYSTAQAEKYVRRVNDRSDTAITVLLPDGTSVGATPTDDAPGVAEGPEPNEGDADGDRDDLGKVSAPRTVQVSDGWLVDIQANSSSGRALVRAYVGDEQVDDDVHTKWAVVAGAAAALLALSALGRRS
jgi:hypothetical protein